MRTLSHLARLGLAAGVLAPGTGGAAQWYAKPRVAQDLGYDSNVRLDGRQSDGAVTSVSRLGLALGGRAPTLDLSLDAELTYSAYAGGGPSSSDAEYLTAGATHQVTPRTNLGLTGSFVRDTAIQDVLDNTGRFQRSNDPRYTYSVTPFLNHDLTSLDTLSATATMRYRDDTNPDGIDFTTLSGQVGWQRDVGRRAQLGGNLYLNRYDSDRQRSDVVSSRLYVGYRQTELVDLALSIGPSLSHTETKFDGSSDTELGFTADGTTSVRLSAVTRASLTASHYLEPSGDDGQISETSRLYAILSRQLSTRLTANAGFLAQRQTPVQGGSGGDRDFVSGGDRDFVQADTGLSYALTERLDLGLRYRLRYEHQDDGDATSNAAFVTVAYRFPEGRTSW